MSENRRRPSGTRAMPRPARSVALRRVMSSPSRRTRPAWTGMNPMSAWIVEVFPAPFGPSSAKISPSPTSNDSPATAETAPYPQPNPSSASLVFIGADVGFLHNRVENRAAGLAVGDDASAHHDH